MVAPKKKTKAKKKTDKKKLESSKKKSSWGGKRENAGRDKGSKNKATLEQKIIMDEIKQRILRSADQLINSQMNLAQGVQMLYKIHTDKKGVRSKPELVTSQREIEEYLAGEYEGNNDDYYFITTERPDNRALDSLLDRTFGKATNNVDVKSDGKPIPILGNLYVPDNDSDAQGGVDEEKDKGHPRRNISQ